MQTKKTYIIGMEIVDLVLGYTITVSLADDQTYKNDRCLHLCWKSQSGMSFEFDGMRVIWPNMHILEDGEVLALFASLETDTPPNDVERLLQKNGFVRTIVEPPPTPQEEGHMWSLEPFRALAGEYDIQLLLHESGAGGTCVTYEHDGRTYPGDYWIVLQRREEACLRLHFAGILSESRRRNALDAQRADLLTRARAGDQQARVQIVENAITYLRQTYGGLDDIHNLLVLQRLREALQARLQEDEVLVRLAAITVENLLLDEQEVEPLLQVWQRVRTQDQARQSAPSQDEPRWGLQQFHALAQEYDIQLSVDRGETETLVIYEHDGNTYGVNPWTILERQEEAHLRLHFAGILSESRRLHACGASITDLLTRVRAGEQAAREQMVERSIMQVRQEYGGISNLALLQQVRLTLWDALDDALIACYPLQSLDHTAHGVVHAWPLQLYDVLRPWRDSVSSLYGDVVWAVMHYYDELLQGA